MQTLYTTYSKADDKALGKGVRLTQCPRCKSFADKYVEHDMVVLFIDLVLIKPQVRATLDMALTRMRMLVLIRARSIAICSSICSDGRMEGLMYA